MAEKANIAFPGRKGRKMPVAVDTRKRFIHNLTQDEELHALIDKMPEAILLTDVQDRIQFLNREAKSLLGEEEEITQPKKWPRKLGFYLDDGITPYPEHQLPMKLALQGETTNNVEMILRKGGDTEGVWISVSSQPMNGEDGKLEGAITFIRDISTRRQIEHSREQHVRRTEALYKLSHQMAEAGTNLKNLSQVVTRFTAEVIGDLSVVVLKDSKDLTLKRTAFFDTDPTGHALMRKLVVYNDQIDEEHSIVGGVIKSGEPLLIPSITPKQMRAMSLPELREFVDRVGIESILIAPLIGRGGVLGAISLSRHRGRPAFTMDDQTFLMDIAYRTALAIENCLLFDSLRIEVAERLSTKRKLDTSEERFRAIFESTTLGIKVLDLNGNILQTNPAFQEMIGYSELELFGRHFSEFLYPADRPEALQIMHAIKTAGISQYLFEHRAVHKDDTIVWVRTTFSPVMKSNDDRKLDYIVGIVENVSERRRIELQMKELRKRLQNNVELERLRLAQELHDNPMQSLYSVIYRIEELRSNANPEMIEDLHSISTEVQSVIDTLRATAQELRPPTIFDFGLENAIRSYVDEFSRKHPHLDISLSLAQDQQMLPEETRLALFRVFQQALMNIMRHSEATQAKVRFSFDAEEVQLEISDNGKGFEVPDDWMEYVRNGHYGLAGSSERVTSLGGRMVVESIPGNTTTITVTIPWQEPE